jgi:hypothetical protein
MKRLVIVGSIAVVVICSSTPTDALAASPSLVSLLQKQLVAALKDCTGRYVYDPEQTAGVAENALAPNELPWRRCAYDAVRTYAEAHPSLDKLYMQLITEDIAMTKGIQDGTLTRSQRRARIEELLVEIRAAEDAQNQVADRQGRGGQNPVESAQRQDQLGRVVASIQGFN